MKVKITGDSNGNGEKVGDIIDVVDSDIDICYESVATGFYISKNDCTVLQDPNSVKSRYSMKLKCICGHEHEMKGILEGDLWLCPCAKSNQYLPNYPYDKMPVNEPTSEVPKHLADEDAGGSALDIQIGGNHYKNFAIQPIEYSMKNKLNFIQADTVKRISRYNLPTGKGLEDLIKIKHEIDLLIEIEGWEEKNGG